MWSFSLLKFVTDNYIIFHPNFVKHLQHVNHILPLARCDNFVGAVKRNLDGKSNCELATLGVFFFWIAIWKKKFIYQKYIRHIGMPVNVVDFV